MLAKDIKPETRRVIVEAPHLAKPLHGYVVGRYSNGRGEWISVQVDGRRAANWYWHAYVRLVKEGPRS